MDYRSQYILPGSANLNSRVDGNNPEFESSFAEILNRTRQNINRISQRYGHTSIDPAGLMPQQ